MTHPINLSGLMAASVQSEKLQQTQKDKQEDGKRTAPRNKPEVTDGALNPTRAGSGLGQGQSGASQAILPAGKRSVRSDSGEDKEEDEEHEGTLDVTV